MKNIYLQLNADNVERLCNICSSFDFDTNVISGRVCVDGKSVIGVMKMCGRVVLLAPVTYDDFEVEEFYRKAKEIGAYYSED